MVERTYGFAALGHVGPLPRIEIEPFDPKLCGPNSYDVHLGPTLRTYVMLGRSDPDTLNRVCKERPWPKQWLDPRADNLTDELVIPPGGLVLDPGTLYLGSTVERMKCEGVVPWIDGRSSIGRLGLSIHVTAGRGDDGWGGQWTLEITVVHPILVFAGLRIGQVTFLTLQGDRDPYKGKYTDQTGPTPSRLHQDTDAP